MDVRSIRSAPVVNAPPRGTLSARSRDSQSIASMAEKQGSAKIHHAAN
jgi:hypothetical protein